MGKLKNAKIMAYEMMIDVIDEHTINAWDEIEDYIENRKVELQEDIFSTISCMIEDHEDFGFLDMDDMEEILEDELGTGFDDTIEDYIYTNWNMP